MEYKEHFSPSFLQTDKWIVIVQKPKLYLETTVPSYLLANPSRDIMVIGRQEITRTWWQRDKKRFRIFVSDVVLSESAAGDPQAAEQRMAFLKGFSVLEPLDSVEPLAQLYIDRGIVPAGSAGDAAHLAFACIHKMDFLCTWNFKHLANAFVLRRLRLLNEAEGLFTPQVCTPEELLGD